MNAQRGGHCVSSLLVNLYSQMLAYYYYIIIYEMAKGNCNNLAVPETLVSGVSQIMTDIVVMITLYCLENIYIACYYYTIIYTRE